jgi:hypothetical protein
MAWPRAKWLPIATIGLLIVDLALGIALLVLEVSR